MNYLDIVYGYYGCIVKNIKILQNGIKIDHL